MLDIIKPANVLLLKIFMTIPTYDGLFNPLLQAIHKLGGSASIAEQEDEVAAILKLSDSEIAEVHKGNRTKLSYRLAWARNYLKRYGVLDNSARGIWALTLEGQQRKTLDETEVKKTVQALDQPAKSHDPSSKVAQPSSELTEMEWEDQLLRVIKKMHPDSFERLCQRLLRESGFIQVEVTGKTNDGGIDGKGVVRVGGLLSFHVIFQCKRYQGSFSSPAIRDFRGAMIGRADKGLFVTTGSFTKDARLEAQRDGAPPIDLIDGEALVEKLKELRIGVMVVQKVVEDVVIDEAFFKGI